MHGRLHAGAAVPSPGPQHNPGGKGDETVLDLIEKTRDGVPLDRDEIRRLVAGIVDNTWPDYQLAAWLMAVVLRGLTDQETFELTGAMAFTDHQPEPLGLADKHSTGGVGDKTTLVLAPLLASLGVPIAKMSGRGLGHTGGTLDKLESIPGFRVELTTREIRRQVDKVGVAVVAQSEELAPADRRLYALRDVTGTVNNISLIASSIMAKKLAGGTPNLVLDVKLGSGAFMADADQARALAKMMVAIGSHYGRRVTALITSMQQPLGFAVGNAIEINEARDCLLGEGPSDLREEVLHLAAELLHLARGTNRQKALEMASDALADGRAWATFREWIAWQGGALESIESPLPLAPIRAEWRATAAGTVSALHTREVGHVALELGAGRHRLGDSVDPGVGLLCYAKIGQRINRRDVLGVVYARSEESAQRAVQCLANTVVWGDPPEPSALVIDRISSTQEETPSAPGVGE